MGKGTIFLIVLFIIAAGIVVYFLLKKGKTSNKCYTKNSNGSLTAVKCSNVKCYHSETDGSLVEVDCNGAGATHLDTAKTIDSYAGQWIKAKYDGTKLYDDSLNVVATYNAGEDIGRLGGRATGYVCCNNNDQFYKILETSHDSGVCQCEPIISDSALKAILGV